VSLCAGMFRHDTSSACIVANITRWIHKTMVVLAVREVTTLMWALKPVSVCEYHIPSLFLQPVTSSCLVREHLKTVLTAALSHREQF
jgi:hypothetical protein